jgi:hypothetical protein
MFIGVDLRLHLHAHSCTVGHIHFDIVDIVLSSHNEVKEFYMSGITEVRSICHFISSTRGTQEQIYCHFLT